MPRIRALIAAASLVLCGLITSPSPAHASTQGDNCNAKWPGHNGSMHAWDWTDCTGAYLAELPETTSTGATASARSPTPATGPGPS